MSTPWQRARSSSKAGFDWAWKQLDKIGAPVNKLSNKLGSEAFWPTDIGRESDKAARILRSFCKDGFYDDIDDAQAERVIPAEEKVDIKGEQKVVKKIPQEIIKNAVGLCIFTTMRSGLWLSGAGGSGVLLARLEDGSWSPPSGVLLHTAGLGFLVGIDIYDCVVVINTREALAAFEHPRFILGGEISAVGGPVGVGGVLETEVHKRQAPVWNYIKSRGFYAGVQIDGTLIIERGDENEKFYGEKLPVKDILAGKVSHPPPEIKMLMETIKAAQGDSNVDTSLLPADDEPAPGDYTLAEPTTKPPSGFGVPKLEDPDPFGVHALEKTGLEIHEAGTGVKPPDEEFEFHPSPTSPIYSAPPSASLDGMMSAQRDSVLGQTRPDADRDKENRKDGVQDDDDGDLASGVGSLRVAAEEEAASTKGMDELASPGIEKLQVVDPIAEAGNELDKQDHAAKKAEVTNMADDDGLEEVELDDGLEKKGPQPTLPPR